MNPATRDERQTVAAIMSKPVVTATRDTTARAARRLLKHAWIRHLPVLDGELLVGMVSDRDLGRARDEDAPLSDIMTQTVFVLSPDTPIHRAARIFLERRFGAMPVVEGRQLVGIVSALDLVGLTADRPTP